VAFTINPLLLPLHLYQSRNTLALGSIEAYKLPSFDPAGFTTHPFSQAGPLPYRNSKKSLTVATEIPVAVYDSPHEAHLAVLHLDSLGIAARLRNDLLVGMAPHLGAGMGGVQVLVKQPEAIEAHAALEALRQDLASERSAKSQSPPGAMGAGRDNARRQSLYFTGLLLAGAALWYLAR
jgi:hypothetical protein